MTKEKTKVYIYTRVSTAMQIDGYGFTFQKQMWLIVLLVDINKLYDYTHK